MRKVSGMSLFVAGVAMVAVSAYLLVNYMTTMQRMAAHMAASGAGNVGFAQGMANGEIAAVVLLVLGVVVLWGGYRLSGKREVVRVR